MNGGFKNNRSFSLASLENSNIIQTPAMDRLFDKKGIKSSRTPFENKNSYCGSSTPSSGRILPTFELSDINMSTVCGFPLNLDIGTEIQNALSAGLLKNIQNTTPKLFSRTHRMLFNKRYLKMINLLFWTIFVLKFQPEADQSLLAEMQAKLSKIYGKYFASLSQPKEELSNIGIMTAGYICHMMFYNLFPRERSRFDMRFILNCYHIVIHELNGIFVSDYYIQSSIEKLFGNKFFFYEDLADEKVVVEKKDLRDEPLLRDLNYDFRDFSQIPGGLTFAKELANKLKVKPKKFKTPTLKELNEKSAIKSAATSPKRNIMKLTELEDNLNVTTAREGVFPKLKLNYHQISPTVSAFLDNSTNSLPCQRKVMINYSSNKPLSNIEPTGHETKKAEEKALKSEKKERTKNKGKGSVSDYMLKNRGEDYYLNHIPKTLRAKFRDELDLKYVMDNVKVSLRGSYTVRDTKDLVAKKLYYNNVENPKVITEQDDEASVVKRGSEIVQNEAKLETTSQEEKESVKEDVMSEKISIEKIPKEMDALVLPKLLSKSRTQKLSRTVSMMMTADITKLADINKKAVGEPQENEDKIENLLSEITEQTAPRLNYKYMENRKLGKGRAFASLERREEFEPESKHPREVFTYKDNRIMYTREHSQIAKGNIDANIEDLVQKLMVKQNTFSKNYGRYSIQSRLTKNK